MKKHIAWFLIPLMALSAGGCKSSAPQANSAVNAGQNAPSGQQAEATPENAAEAASEKPAESEPAADAGNKLKISWVQAGIKEGVNYTGDAYGQYWADKFNVDLDVIACTFDNWTERLRIWINSGDMPDVANWNYDFGELSQYAGQEVIYKLPDGWGSKWANAKSAQDAVPAADVIADKLGGTYTLLRPVFSTNKPVTKLSYHTLLFMRKDWLSACGVELKDSYTISEVIEIAGKIKAQDPGGKGADLLPMCIETTNMGGVLPLNHYTHSVQNPYYAGADGKYKWGPADPETLEGLKIYKSIYAGGLLDPEFYTLEKSFGDQYKFYREGNVGIVTADGMAGRMTTFEKELKENLGLNFDDAVHIAQLTGDDGKYHQAEQGNFWASVIFSPSISDEVFSRAMDMIDFQASPDGQRLVNMGFEGEDWKYAADGSYENLLPEGTSLEDKYPAANFFFGGLLCLGDNFAFESPANKPEYRAEVVKFYKLRDELGKDPSTFLDIDWNFTFYNSTAKSQANMVLADEYAQLVLAGGDLEENWKKWVDEKMQVVQPVLDELNALYAN